MDFFLHLTLRHSLGERLGGLLFHGIKTAMTEPVIHKDSDPKMPCTVIKDSYGEISVQVEAKAPVTHVNEIEQLGEFLLRDTALKAGSSASKSLMNPRTRPLKNKENK